jgi:peptidoglycan/LPS O-acetylase OafA/YrhL
MLTEPMKTGSDLERQSCEEAQPLLPKGKQQIGPNEYRPDVDGLRAFAVVAVVLYHMNPQWMPAGFAGVDIFFVISGFVVTSSLFSHTTSDGSTKDFLVNFFVRRAKRIVPILALVCCSTGIALAVAVPLWEANMTPKFFRVGMAGMLGNANSWMVFGEVHDYWTAGDAAFNDYHPFLHLWSLGVEEQFYLVFPWVILVCWAGISQASYQGFFKAMGLLTVVSLTMAAIFEFKGMGLHKFYLLPPRFFELAVGAMIVPMCNQARESLQNDIMKVRVMELSAGALLVASIVVTQHEAYFPCPWALLPVLAASLYIIVGTATSDTIVNSALASHWPVYIGRLSYSIYLWHMPVLAIVEWSTVDGRKSPTNCLVSASLTLLLSFAGFHLVEEPLRRIKSVSPAQVLGCTAIVSIASALWLKFLMQARTFETADAWLVRSAFMFAAVVATLLGENLSWTRNQKLMLGAGAFIGAVLLQELTIYRQSQPAAGAHVAALFQLGTDSLDIKLKAVFGQMNEHNARP